MSPSPKMSASRSLPDRDRQRKDRVALLVSSDIEDLDPHAAEAPALVERDGLLVFLPHSEPQDFVATLQALFDAALHQRGAESGAEIRRVHIDPCEPDRVRGLDVGMRLVGAQHREAGKVRVDLGDEVDESIVPQLGELDGSRVVVCDVGIDQLRGILLGVGRSKRLCAQLAEPSGVGRRGVTDRRRAADVSHRLDPRIDWCRR